MNAPLKKQTLLSSVEAAEIAGVTSGYITRLCREEKIEGVRKDGLWFVEHAVLVRYLKLVEAEKDARAEKLARERLAEYRQHSGKKPMFRSAVLTRVALASVVAVVLLGSVAWAGGGIISLSAQKRIVAAQEEGIIAHADDQTASVLAAAPPFTELEQFAVSAHKMINEWFWGPVRALATLIAPPGVPQILTTVTPGTHSTTTVMSLVTERVIERSPVYVSRYVTETIFTNGITESYLREQLVAWRNATTEDILEEINDRNDGSGSSDASSFDGNVDNGTITNSTFEGPSVETDTLLAGNATTTSLYTSLLGLGSDYVSDVTGYGLAVVNGELTVTLAASPFATTTADFWFSTKDTDDLAEGSSNLYYTSARFNTAFGTKTTSDLAEGTNQYFTLSRFATALAGTTTDALTEGSTNLYFSNARARSALSAGSGITYATSTGVIALNATGDWTGLFDGQEGSYYLDRANHSGTQLASTISDFSATARGLFSSTAPGVAYDSNTGVFSLAAGYSIPLTASTTNWQTAYSWGNHASAGYITDGNTGWDNSYNLFDKDTDDTDDIAQGSTNLFFTNGRVQTYLDTVDKGYFFSTTSAQYYASQNPTSSFATTSADYWLSGKTTSNLAEGSNQYFTLSRFATALAGTTTDALTEGIANRYFTDARARGVLSSSASGLSYNNATGVFTTTSGYSIPLTASTTEWNTAYANRITSATSPLSISNNVISLSTAGDWTGTLDGQEGSYYLARANHTGTQLASTISNFASTVASIIAGTTTDALAEGSTNQYYTNTRARAAISETITGIDYVAGVFSLTSGYSIPLTASQTDWNTAFSWGNHAVQNYFDKDTDDTDDIAQGSTNLFFTNGRVQTYLDTVDKGYFFSTTSAQYYASQNPTSSFATTSADYWLTTKSTTNLAEGSNLYYTDGRVNAFIAASTTIPKTFANNVWSGANSFAAANLTVTGVTDGCVEFVSGKFTSTGANCGSGSGGITSLNGITTSSQTFATSSDTNIGITVVSTGSTHTFTPTWTGTLVGARGGTGLSSVSANQLLIGGPGNTWTQVATSSLGFPTYSDLGNYLSLASWYATTTDALDEGSTNQYFTTARVQTFLDSISKGYFFSTTSANAWFGTKSTSDLAEGSNQYYTLARFASALAGTTTDALAEGSTNQYYTNARARSALSAGSGITYSTSTGAIALNASGDWTGTFDGQEGSYYLDRANHSGT
ncbi:MAG: helix-turn-helix domain-containing protein, partial [Patescibacteria group bacterium]